MATSHSKSDISLVRSASWLESAQAFGDSDFALRPQQREKDDVANGASTGQDHRQPVDPDALASSGRHGIAESAYVILVHHMRFFIPARLTRKLRLETAPLLLRVIQLCESVCDLHAPGVDFEALHKSRLVGFVLGQRRDLNGEIVNDGRFKELIFDMALKEIDQSGARTRLAGMPLQPFRIFYVIERRLPIAVPELDQCFAHRKLAEIGKIDRPAFALHFG